MFLKPDFIDSQDVSAGLTEDQAVEPDEDAHSRSPILDNLSHANINELSCCANTDDEEFLEEKIQSSYQENKYLSKIFNCIKEMLPLKARQEKLNRESVVIHRAILHSFAERGRAPTRGEMFNLIEGDDLDSILNTLQNNDLIVLNHGVLIGAYPFTLSETPHALLINGHAIYAMCAFDAVGVSAMFNVAVEINSHCAVTDELITINISNQTVLTINHQELKVGINWQSAGDCAARNLCPELVFLRDPSTASKWSSQRKSTLLLTINEAIKLSSAYFLPLIK